MAVKPQILKVFSGECQECSLPSLHFVDGETEAPEVQPQGPQLGARTPLRDAGVGASLKVPVQLGTYLVTSGAEVGRTVFRRASIQFRRIPEVMADKV